MMRSLRAFCMFCITRWRGSPARIGAAATDDESSEPTLDPKLIRGDVTPRRAYDPMDLQQTAHLPRSIFCPITNLPMCDPVLTIDGFSYERDAIAHWFRYKRTSPCTGAHLKTTFVIPNHSLRATIAELVSTL